MMPGTLRVAVVDPSDDECGSMRRYALLVTSILRDAHRGVSVAHVRLGLPRGWARWAPRRLRAPLHHFWVLLKALAWRRRAQFDVLHVIDGSHGYLLRILPGPSVVTVHDLIPWLQIRGVLGGRAPSRLARPLVSMAVRSLAMADWVVADSGVTARDLERHAAVRVDRVHVIPLAPTVAFTDGPPWSATAPTRIPFILHVGSDAFYKNRECVIRVFSQLKLSRPLRLVMVGPRPSATISGLIEREGLSADIDWRQDVDDEVLADLYRHTAVLLFPSLYEGFGWPVLEAMAVGCPVVCSEALAELAGDGALVATAADHLALTAACTEIIDNAGAARELSDRARRRAATFSRDRMGKALIACYEVLARQTTDDARSR
jgi:glycosyltransferase involved in cell wall biosynthesis